MFSSKPPVAGAPRSLPVTVGAAPAGGVVETVLLPAVSGAFCTGCGGVACSTFGSPSIVRLMSISSSAATGASTKFGETSACGASSSTALPSMGIMSVAVLSVGWAGASRPSVGRETSPICSSNSEISSGMAETSSTGASDTISLSSASRVTVWATDCSASNPAAITTARPHNVFLKL